MTPQRKADAWMAFASSAIAGFVPEDEYKTDDDLAEHQVATACNVADRMLVEFEERDDAGFEVEEEEKPAKRRRK